VEIGVVFRTHSCAFGYAIEPYILGIEATSDVLFQRASTRELYTRPTEIAPGESVFSSKNFWQFTQAMNNEETSRVGSVRDGENLIRLRGKTKTTPSGVD
jgi:hypothetical protein